MSTGDLQGKIALVTGGARGIGEAIVRRLVKDGAKVYFTYHVSKDKADRLVAELGPAKAHAFACDVRKKDDIAGVVANILAKETSLHILVNNAGIIQDGLFLSMPDEDWSSVIETNLGGAYYFCKSALRQMVLQREGRVINVSSIVAELGGYGQANYAASKGALNALTKSLASEFASRNITVNAVAPGMVNTEMSAAVRSLYGDKIKEKIPLGSFAEPAEVAAVVAFLAKDEARYITGQIITIDGGISLLARR